jgi:hypothetical protein
MVKSKGSLAVQHRQRGADDMTDTHHGYVAGRYRDGALSDTWTDVRRCAERTFITYVARCRCGWRGKDYPASPDGYHACQRELIRAHLVSIPTHNELGATVQSPEHLPSIPGSRL